MIKIKKDLNSKVISLIIAMLFIFTSTVYGIDMSRNAQLKLRAPLMTQSNLERLMKAQHDFIKEGRLLSPIGCLGRGIKATKEIYQDIRGNGLSCPLARGETATSLYPEAVSLSLSVDGWFNAFAIEEFGPSKSEDNVVFILDSEWVKTHKENFKLIGTNFNPKSTSRDRYLKGLKLLNLDEHPWDITLRLVDFVPRLPIRDEIHFIAISQDQLDAIPPEAIYAIIARPEKIEQILQWDKELGIDPLPIFAWRGGTYIRKLSLFDPNARKTNAQLALEVSSEANKRIAQIGDLETIRGMEDIVTFAEKLGVIEITGEEASSLFTFQMGISVLDKNGWDIIKEMREDMAIFRHLCEEDTYFEWLGKLAAYKEVNRPGIYFNRIAMQHREEETGRKVTKSYFVLQLYELLACELDLTDTDFYNTTFYRHPIIIEGCFRFASLMGSAELEAMHSLIKEFMHSVFFNREKILKNITRLIKYSKTQEFREEALRMFFSKYALNSSAKERQRLQATISSPATYHWVIPSGLGSKSIVNEQELYEVDKLMTEAESSRRQKQYIHALEAAESALAICQEIGATDLAESVQRLIDMLGKEIESESVSAILPMEQKLPQVELLIAGGPVSELEGFYMLEVKVDGVEYEISSEDLKRIKGMDSTIVTNHRERRKIAEAVDGAHPELHLGETALREGWHWWPLESSKKTARTAL